MARRKKTKTSPVSWRLDEDALKALAILENQEPTKERSQIIGEHLIKAAGAEPPPTIQFNELDPREILHLRADLAENRRTVEDLKIALRKAKPNSKEDAGRLSDAILEATKVLKRCLQHDRELRELARGASQVTANELGSLEWLYKVARNSHKWEVKKMAQEPAAKDRAENYAALANLCRHFRPNVGPELKTPAAPPEVEKPVVNGPEFQTPSGLPEIEKFVVSRPEEFAAQTIENAND